MPTAPAGITLDLAQLQDLFSAPDANPFSGREVEILGQSGIDFLRKHYVRRWPQRALPQDLLIRLGADTPADTPADTLADTPADTLAIRTAQSGSTPPETAAALAVDTQAALLRYCAARVEANRAAQQLARAAARRELWIAVVVTLLAIVLLALNAYLELEGIGEYVLAIVTLLAVYAAALAIWDALESWFFDWTPFTVDNMAYRWIRSLQVQITYQTGQEAATHE
jgi:hypothetical protein